MEYDFYIYTAGDFDATKLAKVHTIPPESQAASRYKFPYARACIKHGTDDKNQSIYCAFGKWDGWAKLLKHGVLKAMCGDKPGLHKAVCVYNKNFPTPSVEPPAVIEQRNNNIREFCECVCIALGMSEKDVSVLTTERLIKIASYSAVKMVPLSDFVEVEMSNGVTNKPFIPGDLADFDRWHNEHNPGQ